MNSNSTATAPIRRGRTPTISISDESGCDQALHIHHHAFVSVETESCSAAAIDQCNQDDERTSYSADSETGDTSSDGEEEEEAKVVCFTFTPIEDITPNCVSPPQGVEVTAVATCDASTQVGPALVEQDKPPRKIMVPQKFSLPSVVIQTDCDSSPTYLTKNNSLIKRKPKKKKKESQLAARSKSFHFAKCSATKGGSNIPQLNLPPSADEEKVPDAELNISDDESEEKKSQRRKRRKSLVNLLFSSKQPSNLSATAAAPSAATGGGQKNNGSHLSIRRLSDIVMGSSSQSSRRCSVSQLDTTDKETKDVLESARRRISSFPPSEGDESTAVLEKIHAQSKLDLASGKASSPCRLFRSPISLLSVAKAKKFSSKWKSSTDIAKGSRIYFWTAKCFLNNLCFRHEQ